VLLNLFKKLEERVLLGLIFELEILVNMIQNIDEGEVVVDKHLGKQLVVQKLMLK
jgi:hypothetical protein